MAKIILTVPTNKVDKVLEGFLEIYPNKEMTEDETPVAKYTDVQWIREKLKRILIRDVHRGLVMKAEREATIIKDEDMVE